MASDFDNTLKVSAAAMTAQSVRLRTIAENLANANTAALSPGGDPYRRKVVTFRNELDRATGERLVKVNKIVKDILMAYKADARPWERMADWIDRIGWPRFFEKTGLPFTKYMIDDWRGSRANLNASTHIRF